MDNRFFSSLVAAKAGRLLIKLTGGGATAAPGLASLYLDPNILHKLTSNLETVVLITGTNGKTTTSRLFGSYLNFLGLNYIHNRSGSNLERGLVSALIEESNLSGKLRTKTALFEVDEAALSPILTKINPKVLVITNLFRDQLDRYGEVDNIRKLWEKTIVSLSSEAVLVLNADDPAVANLGKIFRGRVIYFGIKDHSVKLGQEPTALDSSKCPQCYTDLHYSAYYFSHLGDYHCPNCSFARPAPSVVAKEINLTESGSEFTLLEDNNVQLHLETSLPGLYNVYNSLASFAAIKSLNLPIDSFASVLKAFQPVFGRSERLEMEGRKIIVALAKNPTGFNEIIRTFLIKKDEGSVIFAINDLIADGRDVSWLWDVDFESLTAKKLQFWTSGLRAADMALRLKYEGIDNYQVVSSLEQALEDAVSSIPQNDTLTIIPTYTAMLSLKKIFASRGIGGQFWED